MPVELPRWTLPDIPPGIKRWVDTFAGTLERLLAIGAQRGVNAAPNGPAGGGLAGYYPNPVVLTPKTVTAVTSTSGTTLTAAALVGGVILRSGPGSAYTDATDTAANIAAALSSYLQVVGQSFEVMVANTSGAAMTLSPGAGVSFAGNTSSGNFAIGAGVTRILRAVVITGPAIEICG